jgi:UDP-glucose 4-epimerase
MATLLITGGAGFIGSHLAERLLALDQRVIIIDDLSSGSVRNIAHLRSNERLDFVMARVEAGSRLAELMDLADVVFHLAATVGVFNILERPATTLVNNIGSTEALLNAAAEKRKKVILASSSEVYGKSAAIPFREDGDLVLGQTTTSRWSYASSKATDECLALAYWQQHKVPTVVARLFNTIGPRQVGRYGMVVPRFMTQALRGENLTVYGSGEQSRCFTDVSDIVEWLLRLAAHDGAVGEVFNLGNPVEITIAGLARRVIEVCGASVGIDYIPYERAYEHGFEDMGRRVPDITKVTKLTGYAPRVSLDQALQTIRDRLIRDEKWNDSTTFTCEGDSAARETRGVAPAPDSEELIAAERSGDEPRHCVTVSMPAHEPQLLLTPTNGKAPYLLAYEPELVPPPELMRREGIDVLEEWFRWAEEWSMLLRVYGGIRRESAVLEIGCGLGRIAFPLRYVLTSAGTYNGFDISREKIAFLDRAFHRAHPHFRFAWADIHNTHYNPHGQIRAVDYRFPYPNGTFDVVYAASVFTHMLPEAVAHYLRESTRVLKPGGRCVFSFFLLDHYQPGQPRPLGFSRPDFNFDHPYGDFGNDVAIVVPDNPEQMTAYRLRLIERFASDAGLALAQPPLPGLWSGSASTWVGAQDVLLLAKP